MTTQLLLKALLSGIVIAGVSELGKRFTILAALLASLPLVSILAMIWLYLDTGETTPVVKLSQGIFWAVLPSLLFFAVFPFLIKAGLRFWPSLTLACLVMIAGYSIYVALLRRVGISL